MDSTFTDVCEKLVPVGLRVIPKVPGTLVNRPRSGAMLWGIGPRDQITNQQRARFASSNMETTRFSIVIIDN